MADDAFRFTAGAGIRYEDNVFRLPTEYDPQTYLGTSKKSDVVTTVNLGLGFEQTYSQQRFLVMAGITDNRYQNFSHLSFVAKNYLAEWQWYLTSRLTGRIVADRNESLNDFRDYRGYSVRNIRTTDNRRFVADWWAWGNWHLVAGVGENRVNNSQSYAEASSRLRSAEGGVRYVSEANNSVTLLGRTGRGEYPGRAVDTVAYFDNRFDQKEVEMSVAYQVTGKSLLNGRIGRLERNHEHLPQRDYSGTVGRIDYVWRPVQDIDLNFSLARDLVAYQDARSSYYINNLASIAPGWQMSPKTRIGAALQHARRNYRGPVPTPVPLTGGERNDRFNSYGLNLSWLPNRTITVTGAVTHEKLTSNLSGYAFKANVISLSAVARF